MGGIRQAGRQTGSNSRRREMVAHVAPVRVRVRVCRLAGGPEARSQIELSALRAEARAPPSLPKALKRSKGVGGFAKSRDIGFFDTL